MVYQIEIYCAVYFQYSEVRFSYNDSRMRRVFHWRNTAKICLPGLTSKEALESPHSFIRYVTLTDCLEIHQRLHCVGRETTPCIKLVSRRSSSFSTGVHWKQVNTPRFVRKLYFRFFFGGGGYVNDYSKTKPSKNCQLYLLIYERRTSFSLFKEKWVGNWNFIPSQIFILASSKPVCGPLPCPLSR